MSAGRISPRPHIVIRPLPQGRCNVELDAIVDWGTAIEIMKVLGHLGQIAATEQEPCFPHLNRAKSKSGAE
jgi:hypothetical protein